MDPLDRLRAFEPFWGEWTLGEQIGEGSYGRVFRIQRQDITNTYQAALKWIEIPRSEQEVRQLRSEEMTEPEISSYFEEVVRQLGQEITMMSQLRGSRGIVGYEDHLIRRRTDGISWDILIRMELLTPLSDVSKGMTPDQVAELGIQLCDALTLLQTHKVIHRDVKPDNIFVDKRGEYKLGDFGVARQMDKTLGTYSRRGTPYYMAPEVYLNRKYDATVDIYSLGLVMYRLLNRQQMPFLTATDRAPTQQQREEAFGQRIKGQPLPPPIDGDRRLIDAVLRACAYAPADRFPTAEAFKQALLGVGGQAAMPVRRAEPPRAAAPPAPPTPSLRPSPPKPPSPKPPQKRKRWIPAACGLGVLALALALGAWGLLRLNADPGTPPAQGQETPAVVIYTAPPTEAPLPTNPPAVAADDLPMPVSGNGFEYEGRMLVGYTGDAAEVVVPEGVTAIGTRAFAYRYGPTSITLPESLVSIGQQAFFQCHELRAISLPAGVSSIGAEAFAMSWVLESIEVSPENAHYAAVDGVLFTRDMRTLVQYPEARDATHYDVPEGVIAIGDSAFTYCERLQSVTLPESLTAIGIDAFCGCYALASIALPAGLEAIGDGAFSYCANLTSFSLPAGVTGVGSGILAASESLKTIAVNPENAHYTAVDGVLFTRDMRTLVQYPIARSANHYDVPDGVDTIAPRAFYDALHLVSLSLPESLLHVGEHSFALCGRLTTITLPSGVTEIGSAAFAGSESLESIEVSPENTHYTAVDGVLFTRDMRTLLQYPNGRSADHYDMPSGVTAIGDNAFDGRTSLVSVALPEGLASIGDWAFSSNRNLATLSLPASVDFIADTAFFFCESLTLTVTPGSYAETYAQENNLRFVSEWPAATQAPAAEATDRPATAAPTALPAAEATVPPPEATMPSEATPEPTASGDGPVVAVFDGQTLTKGEVEAQVRESIEQQVMYYAMYGQTIDPTDEDFQRNTARTILEDLVKQRVLENRARALGLWTGSGEEKAQVRVQAEAEFEATLDEYTPTFQAQMGGEESGVTLEQAQEEVRTELAAQGYTEEYLYGELLRQAVTDRLYAEVTKDVTFSTEEARALYAEDVAEARNTYQDNPDQYVEDLLTNSELPYVPGGMRLIKHIMLSFPTEGDEAARAAVIEQAGTILAEIKDGTKTFEEAMAESNQDTGMNAPPFDVGYPVHAGTQLFEPAFVEAAMALQNVGDVSGVVEGTYSVHILRYAADLAEKETPFEERAEAYTAERLRAAKDAAYQKAEDEWMVEANIVIDVEPLIGIEVLPAAAVPETQMKHAVAYTQICASPGGDSIHSLDEGALVLEQGSITVEGVPWSFVGLPGWALLYGYVKTSDLRDTEADAAGDATQVIGTAVDWEGSHYPTFTLVLNDGSLLYGELYPDVAPNTVGSFISLANQGFYNGTLFHRVVPGFVLQGGDPEGTGLGGPGYTIRGEFSNNGVPNDIRHERGVLSMARSSDYNSAGSQFFLVLDTAPHLDGEYAAFGRVLAGMEATDAILAVPRDANDKPKVDQVVKLIYVETYHEAYPFEPAGEEAV